MSDNKYSVTQYPVSSILEYIKSGDIAIPEIQRPFVWKSKNVRDLIDSLYNGYPTGYLIIWQNPNVKLKNGKESVGKKILIDGQQRVTALMTAIAGLPVLDENFEEKNKLIKELLGKTKDSFTIEPSFYCDYGWNIEIGENFYSNHNLVILDPAKVTFGDNVFIGPNCGFYTAQHPLDIERRNKGLEWAFPITVGNNVWFGGNVTILPGVTIGDNCTIGAGSVVVKNIPANSLAVGNPCKVIRKIDE